MLRFLVLQSIIIIIIIIIIFILQRTVKNLLQAVVLDAATGFCARKIWQELVVKWLQLHCRRETGVTHCEPYIPHNPYFSRLERQVQKQERQLL
jgi:hypothetical protein